MKNKFLLLALMVSIGATSAQKINGKWTSIAVENLGNSWGTRDFTFDGNNWKLTFIMYGDSNKQYPLFAFDAEGTYTIGKKSETMSNANETEFVFTKKYLTAVTDDPSILKQLGFTSCNLKKGVKTDISESGCSFFASVKNYSLEYDLTYLQGNKLYLGARPADNNLGKPNLRPTKLGYALIKIN
jgi:hypothetical protein